VKNLDLIREKSIKMKAMPLNEEKIKKIIEIAKKYFKDKKISYLEIGSGIGYSFLRLSKELRIKEAFLIEKDKKRFEELKRNVKELSEKIKIHLINKDALNYLKSKKIKKRFDLVLVDANKSKYLDYFLLLKEKSNILVFDNSFFNNLLENKRYKTIIRNLIKFHNHLINENFKELLHFKIKDGITFIIF